MPRVFFGFFFGAAHHGARRPKWNPDQRYTPRIGYQSIRRTGKPAAEPAHRTGGAYLEFRIVSHNVLEFRSISQNGSTFSKTFKNIVGFRTIYETLEGNRIVTRHFVEFI